MPLGFVPLDIEAALMVARKRPGFTEAWDAFEEEHQTLSALLKARQRLLKGYVDNTTIGPKRPAL
jgi:hypothetical protein